MGERGGVIFREIVGNFGQLFQKKLTKDDPNKKVAVCRRPVRLV